MDKIILSQLINQALTDNSAMIKDNELSAICGIPVDEVKAAVQRLAEKGLIEVVGTGRYIIRGVKIDGQELTL